MFAVILAGGSGTRFWPVSRETTPKQLLRIFGDSTMIQQTVRRLNSSIPARNIYIVTSHKYYFDIKSQLSEICGLDRFRMLLEPKPKNTAPAIGLAAIHIKKISPHAVMAVIPSDHIILNKKNFLATLGQAKKTALKGYLTAIGITPDRPETGYGYIRKGMAIGKSKSCKSFKAEFFDEKPNVKKASEYVNSGNYFWNSGIFVWRVSDVLEEIKRQIPDLHKGLVEIENALGKKNEQDVLNNVFKSLNSVSIDYGVMEHAPKVAVVSADMGWCDVGSWHTLDYVAEKDISGNIITGNIIDIGSKNSIIYGGTRLVATIGLNNIVVVDTPDATLICNKNNTQDVKKIVEELKKNSAGELIEHVTVKKPWGSYTVLEVGAGYKIKNISVKPGAKLSLQLHKHRSEHWIVVSGTARVTIGNRTCDLNTNESTFVPVSTKHRLENHGKDYLHIIEVQSGDYLYEDDIVRFDDEYGR